MPEDEKKAVCLTNKRGRCTRTVRQKLKETEGKNIFTESYFVNVAVEPQRKGKTNTCNPLVGGCLNGDRSR